MQKQAKDAPLLDRLLEGLDPGEFPLMTAILETEAGVHLRMELGRLLARSRHSERAERQKVHIVARLRGPHYDECVFVRNVSKSGILVTMEPTVRINIDVPTGIHVLLNTSVGIIDLPVALVRKQATALNQREAAFRFTDIDEAQAEALAELSNLIYLAPPSAGLFGSEVNEA